MTARKKPQKSAKRPSAAREKSGGFTAEEKAAMRERARELKAAARGEDGESAVVARIDAMPEPDRQMAKRLHAVIREAAPSLVPRLWYGMPAYSKDGKVLCYFQNARKFKTRYSTFGFMDTARLDDGSMWPVAFALAELTSDVEARIATLVKNAAG